MSYLITAKQGGVSIETHADGKLSHKTLALGDKVIADTLTSQVERMKAIGMVSVRKATPGEVAKYSTLQP